MESFADIAADVVLDATWDTLYLVPFLLAVYLFMEWLEHKAGDATQRAVRKAGALGPLVGAVLGAFPQCGFSAMGATLYAGRVVTLGTLFAVFLSTSDELLPMMIAEHAPIGQMLAILGVKVVIGMAMGFAVDAVLRMRRRPEEPLAIHKLCAQDHCECSGECATCRENPELTYEHDRILEACACEHDHTHAHDRAHAHDRDHAHAHDYACDRDHDHACDHDHVCDHDHDHAHDHAHGSQNLDCGGRDGDFGPVDGGSGCECEHHHPHQHTGTHIVKSALKHTVQVSAFIWVVSLLLGAAFAVAGEDAVAQVLAANPVAAVFASGLVGLIPNCAASVAVIELYLEGVLGTGAMMSGLLVASGVGLLVLCRSNRNWRQNAVIIAVLYGIGVAWGLVFLALGVVF